MADLTQKVPEDQRLHDPKVEDEPMDKPMSNSHFKVMSVFLKVRDYFTPPKEVLNEVGIKQGFHILDFGCGPGSYSIAAAKLVGISGKVYAQDIQPLAIQRVHRNSPKKLRPIIKTIQSDYETGLSKKSVDVILLYDVLHALSDPDKVLKELHRILKPNSVLSVRIHSKNQNKMLSRITDTDLFTLLKKNKNTYSFLKTDDH